MASGDLAPLLRIVVADGARPDTLAAAIDRGALPALRRLRDEGSAHVVSSVFPSATGPAYAPFLLGRFPGPVGLPGIRWWDRSRTRVGWPHARSYVGVGTRHADGDLDAEAPTLFELAPSAFGSLTPIGRGLTRETRNGFSWSFGARIAWAHFRGDVRDWLGLDRWLGARALRHVRRHQPRFAFIAHPGIDKVSHELGHEAPEVVEAMRIVDDTVATLRADAAADGVADRLHIWIVSDHGHSTVREHDDLASLLGQWGFGVRTHPWVHRGGHDVAVMVSGNAMAQLHLELDRRERPSWSDLAPRWEPVVARLLMRDSVDLVLLPQGDGRCEVRHRTRGRALVTHMGQRWGYEPVSGDPLQLGGPIAADSAASAWLACARSDYPDALVQISQLADAPRSGEIILSATRGWDFREHYEPIPHRSTHGALHREHMEVPLLIGGPIARAPKRTTDVFASACALLGLDQPAVCDGQSFL